MLPRFCLYSILKNLRFHQAFFVLFLLSGPALGGPDLSYVEIGLLVAYQKLLTLLLEVPTGILSDRWGRCRGLVVGFGCHAIAFSLFAVASGIGPGAMWGYLMLAQTLFGIGEAFRTGAHKAVMLAWVEQTSQRGRATRLVAVTRFFSKTTAGLSGLVGGVVLYFTHSFQGLFVLAVVPALLGMGLMLTYPRWLETEMNQGTRLTRPLRSLWAMPGFLFLLLQSVLFESQVALSQHYLQPFLQVSLGAHQVAVVGGIGAVLIGLYYMVQDCFGGLASLASVPVEPRLGGGLPALRVLHVLLPVGVLAIALCLWRDWWIAGVAGFLLITAMQNVRRPIFVAQFDRVMDKPQRATTLSLESQGRGVLFAVLAPLTGYLADHHGLSWAITAIAACGLLGLTLRMLPKPMDHPICEGTRPN